MTKPIIGIVGYGFVGRATAYLFSDFDVRVYDKNPVEDPRPGRSGLSRPTIVADWEEMQPCDVVFVCVPTPMKSDGSCDTSIVESVIKHLVNEVLNRAAVLAIRSTVPPGFTKQMQDWCDDEPHLVFCPEFLTEANWRRDVDTASRVVIGGPYEAASVVAMAFYQAYVARTKDEMPGIALMTSTEAELGKLFANALLATKVALSNEVYALSKKLSADYKQVRFVAVSDERIGPSHTYVPGPDGKLGFGGTCLVKDLNNLWSAMDQCDVDSDVLSGVIDSNEKLRPSKELEEGRAITREKP